MHLLDALLAFEPVEQFAQAFRIAFRHDHFHASVVALLVKAGGDGILELVHQFTQAIFVFSPTGHDENDLVPALKLVQQTVFGQQ